MKGLEAKTIFMVEYETDTSVVREYMTDADYDRLLSDERDGKIRIMNHRNIDFVLREE
ncbi:MAG: hypothetical protein IKS37_10045 [Solobacterium sp.]|jgi:hypothetical protein|nr:hypothetical protein [Solobacterium sp.]